MPRLPDASGWFRRIGHAEQAVLAARIDLHALRQAEYEAQGDLFGTCVNIAARVCDRAEGGQVWTTAVVEGLVEGAELWFEDRGEVELKGVGPRRLARLR